MPKIGTFDAAGFWKNAYAHQRGKLLKKVNVPEDQIIIHLSTKNTWNFQLHYVMKLKLAALTKNELQ